MNANYDLYTDEDKAKVKAANDSVMKAVEARTKLLDEIGEKISNCKAGDEIYDLNSGRKLGIIVDLYRYHRGDYKYDTSPSVEYHFETSPNCIDNTSSQRLSVGTRDGLIRRKESELKLLNTW